MKKFFSELVSYWEMLKCMVRKDLKTRYKGSFLGFLWTFLNPLFQLAIYSFLFPLIMKATAVQRPYSMFLFVALLPWIFFSSSITSSTDCIVENYNLVKKIYFPRQILPLSVSTAGLINYFYGLIITAAGLIVCSRPFLGINLLYLPLLLLILYVCTSGFCLLFSALNVYVRDLEHIVSIITMAWFYATPVVYSMETMPGWVQNILIWNPMATLAESFRSVLFYGETPKPVYLLFAGAEAVIVFTLGVYVFNALEKGFAEEI